ncbi:MAG TPA: hypothetical protein VK137_10965 [Planctomycetaceae bacterium]|nr:hypothetical protein [Planctomycetaceae bacterium]
MIPVRQILWKLLVVGMIPFILGTGLPQMECKCAAAKGQLFCECCFRKPSESRPEDSSLKPCCRQHVASHEKSQATRHIGPSSNCPTCQQFKNSKTGRCCSLKQVTAPTLTKQIDVSEFDVATLWLPLIVGDWQAPVISLTVREDAWSRACCEIPPLDRVIVFEHLVI